jgi:hypothetical protein
VFYVLSFATIYPRCSFDPDCEDKTSLVSLPVYLYH